MAQLVTLHLEAGASAEAHIGAAGLTGQRLAVGPRTLALAPGHSCWPRSKPYLIFVEELEKLRLEALLSLAMLPSKVFWAETVGAIGGVHTRPSFVAGVMFAAVVFHLLGLQAVSPLLVLVKVRSDRTPGPAQPAFVDASVVQTAVVQEGKVAEIPIDGENHSGLVRAVLEFLRSFPWWSRKCQVQAHQQGPQEPQSPHVVVDGPTAYPGRQINRSGQSSLKPER